MLIIGGGLAGLRAAIELQGKCDAAVVCKTYPNLAHSTQAQGGINAAIALEDKWEDHAYDTCYGGDFLNDQEAVAILCREAPHAIEELVEWGVHFNQTGDGKIAQRPFGAQRFHRTCYAADRTGHALLHTLYKRALELGVRIYNETQIVALERNKERVTGIIALDMASGVFSSIGAKAVIMATGGAGRVYGKTTNPDNTGDGIAIAYRAGVGIMDMEMVQFHPTTLRGSNKLLSEAARGEGACLINSKGERFMKRYAPERMELASRDVVSRAEATEILEGRGVLGDSVYLDFRHMDPEVVMSKVPDIRKNGIELVGIDILEDPIPVQPGQHYTMAGIMVDAGCKTELNGLFAVGECACMSVHGANRLGGNSLLETLVFGRIAGKNALRYIKNKALARPDTLEPAGVRAEEDRARQWMANTAKAKESIREIRMKMGRVMDNEAGPFRDGTMLKRAQTAIARLKRGMVMVSEHNEVFNAELQSAYELMFMLDLAECTVRSAMHRTESRGAHYRTDYPKRDDKNWLKHIVCRPGAKGPNLGYRTVDTAMFKPVERKY